MATEHPICPYCHKKSLVTYSDSGSYQQKTTRNCEKCHETYIVYHGNGVIRTEKK